MNSTPASALVIGAGPGLGMSIAHRFGKAGYRIALVSRSANRHPGYLEKLEADGIAATAHAVDVQDPARLSRTLADIAAEHPNIEVMYYGPGATDPASAPEAITETTSETARWAFGWVYPAVDVVQWVLPGMRERGKGSLLFAGGLSGQIPMPMLGGLALSSAALRNYALTLNKALSEVGVYAGTLTIGGLVERGDIHAMVSANAEMAAGAAGMTLNPDDLAETAWEMHARRDRPEATFNAIGLSA